MDMHDEVCSSSALDCSQRVHVRLRTHTLDSIPGKGVFVCRTKSHVRVGLCLQKRWRAGRSFMFASWVMWENGRGKNNIPGEGDIVRAGSGTRTHDILLGKQTFYH